MCQPTTPLSVLGRRCTPVVHMYASGRSAIVYNAENGERMGVLTVNIPEEELGPGEFLVKTWSENEALAAAALLSGDFVDTGRRVPTGRVEAQVWRMAEVSDEPT